MADAGFFKGTSADQDTRFSNKEQALLKSMNAKKSFPTSFSTKVDMRKVNLDVIRPWIAKRVTALVGFEDEVVVEYAMGLLEDKQEPTPDPRKMQINLTGFLTKDAPVFMAELWGLLLEAQTSPAGVPKSFVEEKKEEMMKAKQVDRMAIDENERRGSMNNRRDDSRTAGGDRGGYRGGRGGRGGYSGGRGRGGYGDDSRSDFRDGGRGRGRDSGYANRGRKPSYRQSSRSRSPSYTRRSSRSPRPRSPQPSPPSRRRPRSPSNTPPRRRDHHSRSPVQRRRSASPPRRRRRRRSPSYSRSRSVTRSRSVSRSRSPPRKRDRKRFSSAHSKSRSVGSRSPSRSPSPREREMDVDSPLPPQSTVGELKIKGQADRFRSDADDGLSRRENELKEKALRNKVIRTRKASTNDE